MTKENFIEHIRTSAARIDLLLLSESKERECYPSSQVKADYFVHVSFDLRSLIAGVNDLMNIGYKPIGGIAVIEAGLGERSGYPLEYFPAMLWEWEE